MKTIYRMKWSLGRFQLLLLMLVLALQASAKDIPPKPNPPRLVNDFAGILSSDQVQALEDKLDKFNDTTGNQIAIVTEKTLDGDEISHYAYELAQSWGIGQKGNNNGVLVYIASDDHQMSIQVGYGLEPVITDLAAFAVRSQIMQPNFKAGNFYAGLDSGTNVLMGLADREFTAAEWLKDHPQAENNTGNQQPKRGFPPVLFIVIIVILIALFSRRRRRGGGCMPIFLPFGGGGFGGGRGGGFGGGFGGGSSGGGFGGFGGGGFGGGGSSGSW
jgi:uncharacterized protein